MKCLSLLLPGARGFAAVLSLFLLVSPAVAQSTSTGKSSGPVPGQAATGGLSLANCSGHEAMTQAFKANFTEKLRAWASREMSDVKYKKVFYPFSGPDAGTVVSLFPDAEYYLLVADQIPEFNLIGKSLVCKGEQCERERDLREAECATVAFYARSGFYLTNQLNGVNAPRPRFLKMLAYNFGLLGAEIESVARVLVTADGEIRLDPNKGFKETQGVRFTVRLKEGRQIVVDYLSVDLSNRGLRRRPNVAKAFSKNLTDVVFIKAASHLPQRPDFSDLVGLMQTVRPSVILQDETGMSINLLKDKRVITQYGKFVSGHRLWINEKANLDLAAYFKANPAEKTLPFRIGYEKAGGSMLLLARQQR
jgi:hypothetical protein